MQWNFLFTIVLLLFNMDCIMNIEGKVAFEKFPRKVLCTRFCKPLRRNDLRRRKKKSTHSNGKVPTMNLRGNSLESAAEMSSVPAHVIQLAIDGGLPPVVVSAIESLIFPIGRQEMRRARGSKSIEETADKCNLSPTFYRMVEEGLIRPQNPVYLAMQLGVKLEAVAGPARNILAAKRVARGWSQEFVSTSLNISQPALSRAERGLCDRKLVESILAFLTTGEPVQYESPIDRSSFLRKKYDLTVEDITSLTGLTEDQVLAGCDELDEFFAKLETT